MTWFEDCTPYSYQRVEHALLFNVGWLDPAHEFPTGETSQAFKERLAKRCADEAVVMFRGHHACGLCPSRSVAPVGTGEIRVVADDGRILTAPVLIAHYVEAHGYQPPKAFVAGVLAEEEQEADALAKLVEVARSQRSTHRDVRNAMGFLNVPQSSGYDDTSDRITMTGLVHRRDAVAKRVAADPEAAEVSQAGRPPLVDNLKRAEAAIVEEEKQAAERRVEAAQKSLSMAERRLVPSPAQVRFDRAVRGAALPEDLLCATNLRSALEGEVSWIPALIEDEELVARAKRLLG